MASTCSMNKKRALTYSEDEIMCILQIWADEKIQQKFKTNMRHNLIWEHIKSELIKYGYERSASEIKIKVQNLKSEYKKLKPSSGSATPSWPFYSIMHQVVGQRDICIRSLVHDSLDEYDTEFFLETIENASQSQVDCQVVITEAEVYGPSTKKLKTVKQFNLKQSSSADSQELLASQEQLPQTLSPQQRLQQTSGLQQQQPQEKSQTPPPQHRLLQPREQGQTPPPQQSLPQPPPLQRQQSQEQRQAPTPQHPLRMNRPPRRQGMEENRLINQLISSQNQYMERLAMEEERERRAEEREIRAEERAINAAERESRLSEAMITFFNTNTQYLMSHMQNPQLLSPLSVIPPYIIPPRSATPTGIQSQQVFPPRSPSSPTSRFSPPPDISASINRTRCSPVILPPISRSNPPRFLLRQQNPSPQQQSSTITSQTENSEKQN